MFDQGLELLKKAVRAGTMAVLTTGEPDSAERVVIRLLPASAPNAKAINGSVEEGRGGLIDQLIKSATPLSATIRISEWSVLAFQTIILSQQGRLFGRRVALQIPRHVMVEQRRRAPRERVPKEISVQAQFSLPTGGASGPATVAADVWDLSATGICLWCREADIPPKIKVGDPFDLTLTYSGREQRLTGRFRHRQPMENGGVRLGLHLDATADASPSGQAAAETVRALLDVLTQIRVRRESEKFVTQTLGLAS
jgi:hypothetical protein